MHFIFLEFLSKTVNHKELISIYLIFALMNHTSVEFKFNVFWRRAENWY